LSFVANDVFFARFGGKKKKSIHNKKKHHIETR